ncbi:hypothetical protein BD413DRAFT_630317 [Trametes elegans]|nr:hypothetical protein BD413DRAFT_630317 [Trametes elegans]
MSMIAMTSAVIGLESCNIILMTLLVATPAPKHPMVNSLIVACLVRSTLDILPSILKKVRPGDLPYDQAIQQSAVLSFCFSDSVLLAYATVVKAAFAVSFTLPALWLAIIQIRPKRSADDYPRLTKRTVLLLCLIPFVWALPVLIVPIPRLVRGEINWAKFSVNSCYISDNAFTIVSLVFTLIPLVLAALISCAVVFVVNRWSGKMSSHRATLYSKRSARFAALVIVTCVSATLYAVVLARWIHGHQVWDQPVKLLVRASVMWEAITPLLFFAIFAAQEEIYATWLGWLSHIVHLPKWESDRQVADEHEMSQHVVFDSYISPPDQATYSKVPHGTETPPQSPLPTLPGKIIARNASSRFPRFSLERLPMFGSRGLNPAPRPQLPRVPTTEEQSSRTASRFRSPVVHNPLLSAFGNQQSTHSQLHSGSAGEVSGEDRGDLTTTVGSHDGPPWDGQPRSDTPMSTRTFGRATGSKR